MKKAFAMAMVFLLSLSSGTVAFAGNGQGCISALLPLWNPVRGHHPLSAQHGQLCFSLLQCSSKFKITITARITGTGFHLTTSSRAAWKQRTTSARQRQRTSPQGTRSWRISGGTLSAQHGQLCFSLLQCSSKFKITCSICFGV